MRKIVSMIGNTIFRMYENMQIEKQFVDINLDEVFSNPDDRAKLHDAIEYLKQHQEKEREITLSDNEKLIISIS